MLEENRLSMADKMEMIDIVRGWVAGIASPMIYVIITWTVFLTVLNFLASR